MQLVQRDSLKGSLPYIAQLSIATWGFQAYSVNWCAGIVSGLGGFDERVGTVIPIPQPEVEVVLPPAQEACQDFLDRDVQEGPQEGEGLRLRNSAARPPLHADWEPVLGTYSASATHDTEIGGWDEFFVAVRFIVVQVKELI